MTGKVLEITSLLQPDREGMEIAKYWQTWNMLRQDVINDMREVRSYVFATDTTKTTNNKLPWKNKTTIPKLCQIRDNLLANYIINCFPKKKWLRWEADDKSSNTRDKIRDITGAMCYSISQPSYKQEITKCLMDYVDCGNAFAMPEWRDERVEVKDLRNTTALTQVGYVGPAIRRISPLDIVFNPTSPSFEEAPKIIRSIVSMGEVKSFLDSLSTDDTREAYEELYKYLKGIRGDASQYVGDISEKDSYFMVDGFTDYRSYLESNYVELLTFYGDLYDKDTDTVLKNYVITVVDRHKVIYKKPNQSLFGRPQIYHVGWRKRSDNLWAMGPLANLVGMQYRIDHIENLKADVFDLISAPPLKIKGIVEDFEWGPFARIQVGEDGDVDMMAPPWNVLTANIEIERLEQKMEEMAGSPKEAMGFRTPGEKTKYEVQRMENASGRIYQNKSGQFEEYFIEPGLNGMLELWRRKADATILGRYYDDETKIMRFLELSPDDITGSGKIRPYAARHAAEQAELVQNVTQFWNTVGQDPGIRAHWSTIKLSELFEDIFNLSEYEIVKPFIRLAEEAEAQKIANALRAQVLEEVMQDVNLTPEQMQAATVEQDAQVPFTSGLRGFEANQPVPPEGY